MRSSVQNLSRLALMTAVICVTAPLEIPLGPIPLTLQTFFIALTGALLGWQHALMATAAYMLLGAAGMPVFSGWMGGIGAFAGPTGGFLLGFPLLAGFCGLGKGRPLPLHILLSFTGLILMDMLGVRHLITAAGLSLPAALVAGVWPFLLKDIFCIIVAILTARKIAARLRI